MKLTSILFALSIIIVSCDTSQKTEDVHKENWAKRKIDISNKTNLQTGLSYLSIYSQIYSISQHKTRNLTALASLRNLSTKDTIYILKAGYYGTHGNLLTTYFDHAIYLAPLETTEIIIDEVDIEGGTGSNFIFEWSIPQNCPEPLFEGVMNSTAGQQGLSFTTQSIRIE
ncbi:MAG: hypothetical protein ACJAZK_001874 [Psychroserpens sp.]|jgi:hypothetical protein|uniref:DUF3124 domain-containing protein n=1 Tax=Psychroserpens sp. TaxID=2020870 RepID=UPI0039E40192